MIKLNELKESIDLCIIIDEHSEHHELIDYIIDEDDTRMMEYVNENYKKLEFTEVFSIGHTGEHENKVEAILEKIKKSHPILQIVQKSALTAFEKADIKEKIEKNDLENRVFLKSMNDGGENIYPCEINNGMICLKERESSILLPLHNLDLNYIDIEDTIPPIKEILTLTKAAQNKQTKREVVKNLLTVKSKVEELKTDNIGWLLSRILKKELNLA